MNTKKNLHPYVQPLKPVSYGADLPTIVRGEGIHIQDIQGKVYIDGISGLWNVSLGYGNPTIREAIIHQLDEIPYVNPIQHTNPTTIRFAELLLEIAPENMINALYTCTGSESNELAIKIARKYNQLKRKPHKNKIATLDLSYHGTYYGSMSMSGVDQTVSKEYGPPLPGILFLPTPDSKVDNYNEVEEQLVEIFSEEGETIAAIIIEPILGSGGAIPLPLSYVKLLEQLCKQYDILFVVDEVATGFGRTGKLFGFHHYHIEPDMITLSKGINNGYLPLGATLISKGIYNTFTSHNTTIEHLSTQNGNPLACAAGIATLEIVNDQALLDHVEKIGNYLRMEIHQLLQNHKNVYEIRGKGLMIGIDLVHNKKSLACLSYQELNQMVESLKHKGLIVYPFFNHPRTTGIHIFPPFTITKENVDEILRILKKVFDQTIF